MINQAQTSINKPAQEKGCNTVEELMKILGVGRKTIYSLIRKKAFPAVRIAGVGYRIPRESFQAWMYRAEG